MKSSDIVVQKLSPQYSWKDILTKICEKTGVKASQIKIPNGKRHIREARHRYRWCCFYYLHASKKPTLHFIGETSGSRAKSKHCAAWSSIKKVNDDIDIDNLVFEEISGWMREIDKTLPVAMKPTEEYIRISSENINKYKNLKAKTDVLSHENQMFKIALQNVYKLLMNSHGEKIGYGTVDELIWLANETGINLQEITFDEEVLNKISGYYITELSKTA